MAPRSMGFIDEVRAPVRREVPSLQSCAELVSSIIRWA